MSIDFVEVGYSFNLWPDYSRSDYEILGIFLLVKITVEKWHKPFDILRSLQEYCSVSLPGHRSRSAKLVACCCRINSKHVLVVKLQHQQSQLIQTQASDPLKFEFAPPNTDTKVCEFIFD